MTSVEAIMTIQEYAKPVISCHPITMPSALRSQHLNIFPFDSVKTADPQIRKLFEDCGREVDIVGTIATTTSINDGGSRSFPPIGYRDSSVAYRVSEEMVSPQGYLCRCCPSLIGISRCGTALKGRSVLAIFMSKTIKWMSPTGSCQMSREPWIR